MKIKREDDETVVVAVDASEEDNASSLLLAAASDPNNKLQPNQALQCKYPPGCHVYFSITAANNNALLRSTTSYMARMGVVMAIYIDFKSSIFEKVYEILIETHEHNERLFLLEEQLTFATNCQVKVKGKDATELGVKGLVGIIIGPQLPTTNNNNKSYTIQFTLDGGSRVIGMCNVDPKDVIYVPPTSKLCNEDGNGGTVDITLKSNVETGNALSSEVEQEMDKMNDNVDGNLYERQSSIVQSNVETRKSPLTVVQMKQTLLTSPASDLLPLVSCDSASSSLTSEQLQQEEAELLNIRHSTSTTTSTLAEVRKSFDESRVVGKSSFEDTQNGMIQVQSRWEPPPKRTTATEDKQDWSLRVNENERMKEVFDIPYNIVRYIVGQGGEIIDDIQQRTGCKIAIDREETPAVRGMRTVTLTAPNLAAITECIASIERIVSEKIKWHGIGDKVESNCDLTVPMWVMKKCTKDDELFRECIIHIRCKFICYNFIVLILDIDQISTYSWN
jgi:hypothetical protein